MICISDAKSTLDLEKEAIKRQKFTIDELMDKAGRALAKEVLKKKPKGLVTIICGRGNNGGDGFAAARYLNREGIEVKVIALYDKEKYSKAALNAFEELSEEIIAEKDHENLIKNSEIIVDAIFGFSFKPPVRQHELTYIELINESNAYTISADVPSALEATTGEVEEKKVVFANKTICFTCLKRGLLTAKGPDYAGNIVVAEIGVKQAIAFKFAQAFAVTENEVKKMLPKRAALTHKKAVGTVLVISGSAEFSGAPVMTSVAAYRAGAGYVTLVVPQKIKTLMQEKISPEIIVKGVGKDTDGIFKKYHVSKIVELAKDYDSIAFGPGLSLNKETLDFAIDFLKKIERPVVVDADGLKAIAKDKNILKKIKADFVLTPHAGELSVLTGLSVFEIEKDRFKAASKLVFEKVTTLLKGRYTIIHNGEKLFVNMTSNPGMATAGTGDVLTGIIAAFIAQGMEAEKAAVAGSFVHGMAGDIAAKEMSEHYLIATDIIKYLKKAFKRLEV